MEQLAITKIFQNGLSFEKQLKKLFFTTKEKIEDQYLIEKLQL